MTIFKPYFRELCPTDDLLHLIEEKTETPIE